MLSLALKWFRTIKYVVIYYILGGSAILEDLIHKRNNKVALQKRPKHVAIVTGGSRGIGRGVVQKLMECEMHVVIGCISVQNGESTVQQLRNSGVTSGSASVLELDLKSLKSVQKFASAFSEKHEYLNILVNNAGIMFGPYEETEDGFESQFAVNYLGHFLLTQLLLPSMKRASGLFDSNPKIVNVSSVAHEVSPEINFDDINMKKMYVEQAAYAQSKLCLLMFSSTLDRRLKSIQSNIQCIALHPGIVNTQLFDGTLLKLLTPWVLSIFCKTPEQGATTIAYCCVDKETENAGGSYFCNCRRVPYLKYADNVAVQDRLYDFSMDAIRPFLLKT